MRDQLNEYVRQLHEKRGAIGQSVHFALGRFAKREAFPAVTCSLPWTDLNGITRDQVQATLDALGQLRAQATATSRRQQALARGDDLAHPFGGAPVGSNHHVDFLGEGNVKVECQVDLLVRQAEFVR